MKLNQLNKTKKDLDHFTKSKNNFRKFKKNVSRMQIKNITKNWDKNDAKKVISFTKDKDICQVQ